MGDVARSLKNSALAITLSVGVLIASCSKIEIGSRGSDVHPMTAAGESTPIELLHSAFSVASHGQGTSPVDQGLLITGSSFIEPRSEFRIELDAVAGFDSSSLSLGLAEVFRTGMEDSAAATLRLSGGRLIVESPALFGAASAHLCVRLSGLRSSSGEEYQTTRIVLGRLFTDIDGNGEVADVDRKLINSNAANDPTASTAAPEVVRSDVNLDGVVGSTDGIQAEENLGLQLPSGDGADLCN